MIKISELSSVDRGKQIELMALMVNTERKTKRNGDFYLEITLQDKTGTITVPIWDNWEQYEVDEKPVVLITGTVDDYNNMPQIKKQTLKRIQDADKSEFVPTYDIPQNLIDEFLKIVENMKEPYKSVVIKGTGCFGSDEKLFKEFLSFPSAVRHHGNRRGGGFLHTFGVLKATIYMLESYQNNPFFNYSDTKLINEDRMILKAIFHDIAKMEEYEYEIGISKKQIFIDHRALGVAYFSKVNKECGEVINESESADICYSILSHHGNYGQGCYALKTIEDKILHSADMVDSQIVGHIESGKFTE